MSQRNRFSDLLEQIDDRSAAETEGLILDALLQTYIRAIQERQTQVIKLVSNQGASAWDVAMKMFPGTDDVHRFLAVSEAVAHLDLAHTEGKLALELSGAKEVYKPL